MDISKGLMLAKKNGLDPVGIEKIRLAASTLPDSFISIKMEGMESEKSLTLMSRILRKLSVKLNINYSHPDVINQSNLPVEDAPRKSYHHSESYGTGNDYASEVQIDLAENE